MKRIISYISLSAYMVLSMTACNKILDKKPQNKFSEEVVFSDINVADRYLLDNYNTSLVGGVGYLSYASLSDESHDTHGFETTNYLRGSISPSNVGPFGNFAFGYTTWAGLYKNIQKLNTFIVNIDKVSAVYPVAQQPTVQAQADRMKGEARFLRAFNYLQIARNYGGALLISQPFALGQDYSTVTRSTFKQTVDFISAECDTAIMMLGTKAEMELGRATKEAAMALKSRMLLFAASDLTADGTASSELVGYQSPDRVALWVAARDAAKAIIDMGTVQLANFGAPDQAAVAQNYFNFFKGKDLTNAEIIWGKMFLKDVGARNQMNLVNGTNGFVMYGCNAPTGNLADAFQMADGTPFFSSYTIDNNGYYQNTSGTYTSKNIYYNREPRFYAEILYDSAVWQKRFPDLAGRDPLGIYDRRTRITTQGGQEKSKIYGIDTKQGPVDPDDGTFTGYTFKKYLDDQVYGTEATNNENVWVEFRYAEVLLNYAEACIALGATTDAANAINQVRNRAGLPNFLGDITAALRYERRVEFVYEDFRFYDMRRWKILSETLVDAYGVDIIETKNLDNNTTTTTWQKIPVETRGPEDPKLYWIPIPITETKKAPQLIQNPGY